MVYLLDSILDSISDGVTCIINAVAEMTTRLSSNCPLWILCIVLIVNVIFLVVIRQRFRQLVKNKKILNNDDNNKEVL